MQEVVHTSGWRVPERRELHLRTFLLAGPRFYFPTAMLPIHYACAYGASVEVLNALIDSWDHSLRETDSRGRTPLHFMMGNADRANSPKVVELLLGLHPGAMEQLDAEGNLPLTLLSTKARTIQDGQVEERSTMSRCLMVLIVLVMVHEK